MFGYYMHLSELIKTLFLLLILYKILHISLFTWYGVPPKFDLGDSGDEVG